MRRKFGPLPPAEWDAALFALSDAQLQHGLNELMKSGRGHAPTLPEFLTYCRTAREWVNPTAEDRQLEDNRFDRWELVANKHLMAYLMRKALAHTAKYDAAATAVLVEAKKLWAQCMRETEDNREVDVESQQAMWGHYLAAAERRIAERIAA